jgi:DNA invertase Pin-like site-specific DNA recombinase
MTVAYSYLRFSDPRQAAGDSIRRQTAATDEYCRRHHLLLDDSLRLVDRGRSGYHAENLLPTGRLAAFLAAIEAGKVSAGSTLIVENLDRLSRNLVLKSVQLLTSILEAGVIVVTLVPERKYTYAEVNANPMTIMEIVMSFSLAYEESRKKAKRITEEWQERVRQAGNGGKKLGRCCPAWLRLSDDRMAYVPIPDAVATVRRIFALADEGKGVFYTASLFNREHVPFLGRSKVWGKAYIHDILTDRSVIGEFQPMTGKHPNKKPFGPLLKNYFPSIIPEDQFYRIQNGLTKRKRLGGPHGKGIANLFTGLLKDARDKSMLTIQIKHEYAKAPSHKKVITGRRMIGSTMARNGKPGTKYVGFSYDLVESAIIRWVDEIKASDLLPPENGRKVDRLAEMTAKLDGLTAKVDTIKTRIAKHPDVAELLDVLADTSRERKTLAEEVENLKAEQSTQTPKNTVEDAKGLVRLLATAEEPKRTELRNALKAKLRSLISEIYCLFHDVCYVGSRDRACRGRMAVIEIHFHGGHTRTLITTSFASPRACIRCPIEGWDLKRDHRICERMLDEMSEQVAGDFGFGKPWQPYLVKRRPTK